MVTSRTAVEPESKEDEGEEAEITEKTPVADSAPSGDGEVAPDGQINDI